MSGSGIRWAICKSAPRSRQITTRQHPTTHVFTGRMPFLPPNQQRQSTEGHKIIINNTVNLFSKTVIGSLVISSRNTTPPDQCGPRIRPRTNVDPPRSAGGISSRRAITCFSYVTMIYLSEFRVNGILGKYLRKYHHFVTIG